MKIIYVPIEKVPTRYTADWIEQFETEFKKAGVDFETVEGNRKEIPITAGSVLDAYGTNQYKLEQLHHLIDMIRLGDITQDDVILFADAWFPGIESLFYIRNITGIEFKMAGIYHAGTWDPYDFTSRTGMRDWGQHIELGWLRGLDVIFVATQFHKDLIVMNSGDFDESKIFVTGIPFYARELQRKYFPDPAVRPIKENIVVFPHRLDPEKHPEKFDKLKKKYPQWTFIKTMEATSNREEYFKLLARSKVMISWAEQETFGYSTVEAMALGNFVIVPNQLSYRETVPRHCRYNNEKEIPILLENFMNSPEVPVYPELEKWKDSIPNMLRVLQFNMPDAQKARKEIETKTKTEQANTAQEQKEKVLTQNFIKQVSKDYSLSQKLSKDK